MTTALQSPLQTGLGSHVLTGDAWIAPNKFLFPLPDKIHSNRVQRKQMGKKKKKDPAHSFHCAIYKVCGFSFPLMWAWPLALCQPPAEASRRGGAAATSLTGASILARRGGFFSWCLLISPEG